MNNFEEIIGDFLEENLKGHWYIFLWEFDLNLIIDDYALERIVKFISNSKCIDGESYYIRESDGNDDNVDSNSDKNIDLSIFNKFAYKSIYTNCKTIGLDEKK